MTALLYTLTTNAHKIYRESRDDISTWLVFDGLDTYSTIKLCDQIIATTDNQFRQWFYDVSDVVNNCESDLVLSINFGSVPRIIDVLDAQGNESESSTKNILFTCSR
jgi:beta-galactosidase/beta-glucuronidase